MSNKFSSSRPVAAASKPSAFGSSTTTKNVNADAIIKLLLSEKGRAIGVTNSDLSEDMIGNLIEKA